LLDNRVTIDRLRQLEVTIYEKVREKTYIKKDEGIKSQSAFRFFDMEDKGVVNFKRFVQTLEKLGCKFTDK
jgi:Ca2+-binding EF-hand superfamily protein